MTHDELLIELNRRLEVALYNGDPQSIHALRAVVELHKMDGVVTTIKTGKTLFVATDLAHIDFHLQMAKRYLRGNVWSVMSGLTSLVTTQGHSAQLIGGMSNE
jgi:hypothetical protein